MYVCTSVGPWHSSQFSLQYAMCVRCKCVRVIIFPIRGNGSQTRWANANGTLATGMHSGSKVHVAGRQVTSIHVAYRHVASTYVSGTQVVGRYVAGTYVAGKDVAGRHVWGRYVAGRYVEGRDVAIIYVAARYVAGRSP